MTTLLDLLGHRSDVLPSRPDMLAQTMELRDRFDRYHNNPHPLKPGDFVMEKRGMGSFKPTVRPTLLLILWRMLDPSSPFDRDLARQFAANRNVCALDCIIAYVNDNATTLVFELRAIAELEPWVPAPGYNSSVITDGIDETATSAAPARDTTPPTAGDPRQSSVRSPAASCLNGGVSQ